MKDLIVNNQIKVRVSVKAHSNMIKIENGYVRVYITVAPEDGKANDAVIKLIAKELGISKSSLKIVSGKKDRNKIMEII